MQKMCAFDGILVCVNLLFLFSALLSDCSTFFKFLKDHWIIRVFFDRIVLSFSDWIIFHNLFKSRIHFAFIPKKKKMMITGRHRKFLLLVGILKV